MIDEETAHATGEDRRLRIGIFGGTFDPIHRGHVAVAEAVRSALELDRMLLVVANDPWQKADREVSPAEDRYAMVVAAVSNSQDLEASRIEIERGGPSYTIDTVRQLTKEHPGAEVFVVIGADVVASLATWHDARALADSVTLAVVNRPGTPLMEVPSGWKVLPVTVPPMDVSATSLRAALGQSDAHARAVVASALPASVIRCIDERGLYAQRR